MAQCQLYCEDVRTVLSSININLDTIILSNYQVEAQVETQLKLPWYPGGLGLQASNAEDGGFHPCGEPTPQYGESTSTKKKKVFGFFLKKNFQLKIKK